MKTAISIPDQVFDRAERFARDKKLTRSALFTKAVEEFIQQHQPREVTAQLNELYPEQDSALDPLLAEIQAHSLQKEQW